MRNERLRGIKWMGQMLTALFFLASSLPASAAKVMLEGTCYQIRWGQAENDDYVLPYPPEWTPGPYCFKMGTSIRVRVVAGPGETITRWKLTGASLYSLPFDLYYWSIPESDWLTPDQTYELPGLPTFIDMVTLEGDVVMDIQGQPPGGEGFAAESFGRSSDIYIVLDVPRIPMAPAWEPVLHRSCDWAAGESTSVGANEALTDRLYSLGIYQIGRRYVPVANDSGETFYLKSFLADPQCPFGECEDFADYLVCLSTSVGTSPLVKTQRTNALAGPGFWYNLLDPAGAQPPLADYWVYHQFGLVSTSVWDGAISIMFFGSPKNWARDSTYKNRLVHHYAVGGAWNPMPAGGFTPIVTTDSLPNP